MWRRQLLLRERCGKPEPMLRLMRPCALKKKGELRRGRLLLPEVYCKFWRQLEGQHPDRSECPAAALEQDRVRRLKS